MPPDGGTVTRQVSRVLPSDEGSVRCRVEVAKGALFKRIEEEKGLGDWAPLPRRHSDSWNNRLRHYGYAPAWTGTPPTSWPRSSPERHDNWQAAITLGHLRAAGLIQARPRIAAGKRQCRIGDGEPPMQAAKLSGGRRMPGPCSCTTRRSSVLAEALGVKRTDLLHGSEHPQV